MIPIAFPEHGAHDAAQEFVEIILRLRCYLLAFMCISFYEEFYLQSIVLMALRVHSFNALSMVRTTLLKNLSRLSTDCSASF